MTSENYRRLGEMLYEKTILPKDIGVASRQVNYWKSKKILPFFPQDIKKRGKMNPLQAIWMLIIKELSDMGISSARLAQLSHDTWELPKKEKYADKVLRDQLTSKKNQFSQSDREFLENRLSDEKYLEILREELNEFTDTVKSCLMVDYEPHYMIYSPATGLFDFVCDGTETVINLTAKYSKDPIICIPIIHKITTVLGLELANPTKDLNYLTALQHQIRDIVIFKEPKSVVISADNNLIKAKKITEKHVRQEELADFFVRNKIPNGTRLLIDVRSQGNYKLTLITK